MRETVPPVHRTFARAMRGDATKAESLSLAGAAQQVTGGYEVQAAGAARRIHSGFRLLREASDIKVDGGQH